MPERSEHLRYQTVNIFFAVLILLVFIYSLAYPPAGGHPVPSLYTWFTGKVSPTAGLSRSFSAIVRGDLILAKHLSPYGIPLFLFLLIQLAMRTTAFLLLRKNNISCKKILVPDVVFSLILFVICYGKLLWLMTGV